MYSDYVIYVDESGDHGLAPQSIDPNYPVFVLAFCIFAKSDYINTAVPKVQKLKFRWFGHDTIILHRNKIKKQETPFAFLQYDNKEKQFMRDIGNIVQDAPFTLVASVIHKDKLRDQYTDPINPYHIAIQFCLERSYFFLNDRGDASKLTHVVVECRGKKEDEELELAFRRICDNKRWQNFDIVLVDKKTNSTGLQLADLIAQPIGRHVLDSTQQNRAYDIIEQKFRRGPTGKILGWGLKVLP